VYPCGTPLPLASNLNYATGQTVSNEVLVEPGAGGAVCIYSKSPTHVIADLNATFAPNGAGTFTALVAGRMGDTRLSTKLAAGESVEWTVLGGDGTSATTALALNVAATETEGAGYLTLYPCGGTVPLASNLNFSGGQTISNHVTASVGDGGSICIYASAATHVVVDVEGIYRGEPIDS
jgi:hypothetical protein